MVGKTGWKGEHTNTNKMIYIVEIASEVIFEHVFPGQEVYEIIKIKKNFVGIFILLGIFWDDGSI